MTRYCALGNHFTARERFRRKSNGVPVRDCLTCEERRRAAIAVRSPAADVAQARRDGLGTFAARGGPLLATAEFPGVDIEIHKVWPKRRRA